jgi:hypothetical protein
MTSKTGERTRRGGTWRSAFGVLLFLLPLSATAAGNEMNTIQSIKAVPSGIEIELNSTKPFPVRSQITVLRIGGNEFTRSRHPENGSLNTLIFTLTSDEFGQTATGDPVRVQYGRGEVADRWDFGTLDKSQLH